MLKAHEVCAYEGKNAVRDSAVKAGTERSGNGGVAANRIKAGQKKTGCFGKD